MTRRLATSGFPPSGASGTRLYTMLIGFAVPVLDPLHALGRQVAQDRAQYVGGVPHHRTGIEKIGADDHRGLDRKSTRLNSSHGYISYAVFCLKKKKKTTKRSTSFYSRQITECV